MTWNITGDIGSGMVSSEELCQRWQLINLYTQCFTWPILRPLKERILFESHAADGIKCLDTCAKYNRAQAPIFSDQATFDELLSWAINTTSDPVTKQLYPGVMGTAFWIGITYLSEKLCVSFHWQHHFSDHETEGVWRNYYTGEKVDLSFAAATDLDGGELLNCAALIGPWNGWSDWTCMITKVLNTKES